MKKIWKINKTKNKFSILVISIILLLSASSSMGQILERPSQENTSETHSVQSYYDEKHRSSSDSISDTLLYQGFEDGVMPPPDGWIESHVGSTSQKHWEIIDAATEPGLVYSGEYAAFVDSDWMNSQDEWLISPEVDLTGNLETVNLTFWANTSYSGSSCTVYVYVDIGDGFNHKVWDMVVDEPDWPGEQIYRMVDLDISEFIGEVITIKWHYTGIALNFPFALDDIFVYSKEKKLPIIKIGNITGGWAGFGKGAKVSAEIKNVGVGNASDVYWNISIIGNGVIRELNWSFDGTIPLLLAGGLEIVRTPEDAKIYGFGKINITVHAREPKYGSEDTRSVNGFLLFFFIIILGEDNSSSSCFKIRGG